MNILTVDLKKMEFSVEMFIHKNGMLLPLWLDEKNSHIYKNRKKRKKKKMNRGDIAGNAEEEVKMFTLCFMKLFTTSFSNLLLV